MSHKIENQGVKLIQTNEGKLELHHKGEPIPFIQDIMITQDMDDQHHNIAMVTVDILVSTKPVEKVDPSKFIISGEELKKKFEEMYRV